MKRKRGLLTVLTMAALIVFAAFNTAANCKKEPVETQHECKFEKAWTYNESEHWHKCIGEGATACDKVSDKAAHEWNDGEVTLQPTYTEKGEKTYTCKVCPATKKEELPTTAHECKFDQAWTYNESEHWHKCIGEGATACDKVSDKAAHEWNDGEVTLQPTYTEKGEKTYTCKVCPATKKEELPTTAHECKFEKAWTYNESEHWHKCVGEGATTCDKVSDKAAHEWNDGEVTLQPTYTEKGEKTYTCKVCPATKKEELPVKQHKCNFEQAWTYNESEHWHKCIGEGATPCDKVSDKAAHEWNDGEVTLQPTYTEKGEKTYTCKICPATKKEGIATVTLPGEDEAWAKMMSEAKKAKENASYGVRVSDGFNDTLVQRAASSEYVFNTDGKAVNKSRYVEKDGNYTSYTVLMQRGGKYYRAEASDEKAFAVEKVNEITEYFMKTSAKATKNLLDGFIGSKEEITDYLFEKLLYEMSWSNDKDGNPITASEEDITIKVNVKGSGNKIIIELVAVVNPEIVKKMWYEEMNFTSFVAKLSYTFDDGMFYKAEYSTEKGYVQDGKEGIYSEFQYVEMLASPDYTLYDKAVNAMNWDGVDLSSVQPYTIAVYMYLDIYADQMDNFKNFDAAITENAVKKINDEVHDIIYKINIKFKGKLTARVYADENKTVLIDENYNFGYACSSLGLYTTLYIDILPEDESKVLVTYTYEKRSVSEDGSTSAITRNEYAFVDKNSDYEIATGYMYEYFEDEVTVNGVKVTDKKVKVGEKNLAIHCLKLLGPDESTDFIEHHINCTESDEYGFDEKTHWKKCTAYGCDNKLKVGAHQWDNGIIIEEATAEKDGVKKYTCEICNYEKDESYSLTPDTPDPVDPISGEFEKMLTAVENTRKNRPKAIKKTFYLGANGMSLNAETVVFADGRTATKQVRTMGSDSSADYAFLTGANGKYYNKKRVTSGEGNILFIDSPVPKSFADTAFDVLLEQMLYYCRDKKECETFYPLMLKNSFVMGVFEKTTGKFAVPELSDIEYNITCSIVNDSYNEILVHITVKDDYFKSVIGAGGETLNMMTFSLTIKYDDDGLIGAKFYQGVTYTESDGVTVITNESYFEYTVLRDVTEGTALYNEVKKAVYSGENATEEGQQVSIGIIANGAYLDSSYFGSYNISSPALYAELKAKIARFAGEIEKVAPGKFTVEAFLDEKFTVAFDENYSTAYYDEFFSPRIYLRVTSISGEDCIAFLSYYKTGSDHILSMGGSGTLGTKAVVFKKTDAYKIDTQFESETYGDLISVNDIYTKSDVYDASKSDLLIIECHKQI